MLELCDWPVDYSGCGGSSGALSDSSIVTSTTGVPVLDGMTEDQRAVWERMAGEFLWNWTNRLFGLCEVTLRPCSSGCHGWKIYTDTFWGRGPFPWQGSWDGGSWVPVLIGGNWYNLTCGCVSECTCSLEGPTSLALPGPVDSIVSVRVNGVTLPSSAYTLSYKRFLVRKDGGVWPSCQNLLADATEQDTFEVVYKRGIPVPVGGQVAAGVLAGEFAKAACNDRGCQLPKRLQTITRQDVTVTLMDNFADLQKGGTGIWLIDSWVQSVVAPRPFSSVRSVDIKPKVPSYGR